MIDVKRLFDLNVTIFERPNDELFRSSDFEFKDCVTMIPCFC